MNSLDVKIDVISDVRSFMYDELESVLSTRGKELSETHVYLLDLLVHYTRMDVMSGDPLKDFLGEDSPDYDMPLVLLIPYIESLEDGKRSVLLRHLGNNLLFVTGFHPEYFDSTLNNRTYYQKMGQVSFGKLASYTHKRIYRNLERSFNSLSDVLSELSSKWHTSMEEGDLNRLDSRYLITTHQNP